MATVSPKLAPVRPRAGGRGIERARLLEEIVEEYAEDVPAGIVWLLGEKGAGKSTALAHLAACFQGNPHLIFLDDADDLDEETVCENFSTPAEEVIVVATRREESRTENLQLRLEPWKTDEMLEYLLAAHPQECGSVIERLGEEAKKSWDPEVARVILDEMAGDANLSDAVAALISRVRQQLNSPEQFRTARQFCLEATSPPYKQSWWGRSKFSRLSVGVKNLLRHKIVQVPLAAEELCIELESRRLPKALENQLSLGVVEAVGKAAKGHPELLNSLLRILEATPRGRSQSMAASILKCMDPDWILSAEIAAPDLGGAYFANVEWPEIDLRESHLELAEFYGANLTGANFDEAIVVETDFNNANLKGSSFEKALAVGASFDRADLRQANLCQTGLEKASLIGADLRGAELRKANLCRADLSEARFQDAKMTEATLVGANLNDADFSHANLNKVDARRVDFRTVELSGANLEAAWLNGANLEDVVWSQARLPKAGLRGAHLTGSRLPAADLREADLFSAGLGEIDWEDADLRGANLTDATFHMGSSRSGLVNSPIASEGTRTGFYTDDLEELYFKSPEEVRKANLRGADLRGAKIDHVDFYLVDLREAKLDSHQRVQAARTGAILSG